MQKLSCLRGDENFKNSTLDQRDATIAQMEVAQDLIPELEALTSKTELTEDEQNRLKLIVDQLNKAFPDLGLEIDSVTGKLNMQISTIKDATAAWIQLARAQAAGNLVTEASTKVLELKSKKNEALNQITPESVIKSHETAFYAAEAAYYNVPEGEWEERDRLYAEYKAAEAILEKAETKNERAKEQIRELEGQIASAEADEKYYAQEYEEYIKAEDILNALGFSTGGASDKASSSGKTGSGSSSGSSNAERDAREAEQQRKEAVEDYIDSIKALEEADADWNDNQEHYGKLTLNDQLYNLNEREKRYRNYCDLITNLFNKSEEELQRLPGAGPAVRAGCFGYFHHDGGRTDKVQQGICQTGGQDGQRGLRRPPQDI